MKTVNDYIAHYDGDSEVLIYADLSDFQRDIYYEGTLGNVPEYLRSQDVICHEWYAGDLELLINCCISNYVVRRCFYGDYCRLF